MAYQKCPVCNGSGAGHLPLFPTTNDVRPPCRPCSGTGIIDELTGAPPRYNRELVPAVSRNYYSATFEEACRKFEQDMASVVTYGSRNNSAPENTDFRDRPMEQQFDK
jgi:hypothetical protein